MITIRIFPLKKIPSLVADVVIRLDDCIVGVKMEVDAKDVLSTSTGYYSITV